MIWCGRTRLQPLDIPSRLINNLINLSSFNVIGLVFNDSGTSVSVTTLSDF